MRVIAGKFKGKQLNEFNLSSTRPTADMVREALFDKIGLNVDGKFFLDLFAGTGAVGIEALSRNASKCFFADINAEAIKIIKQNLKIVKIDNFEVLNFDYLTALETYKKRGLCFDFIFLDPPYKTDYAEKSIEFIINNKRQCW